MLNSEKTELSLNKVVLADLKTDAQQIVNFARDIDVWIFEGHMGAGKTTLIKSICDEFGVLDNVTSPTFSIINEYMNHQDEEFYHFDFYRIEKEQEAVDIGCVDYFYSENKCFIEWPSKIPNLLPDKKLSINLSIVDGNTRSIKVIKHV